MRSDGPTRTRTFDDLGNSFEVTMYVGECYLDGRWWGVEVQHVALSDLLQQGRLPSRAVGDGSSARAATWPATQDGYRAIFGPPPAPTEPNRNGSPRLAPAFAEWLMCIKAIGNGVCPPQLAQAWRYLTGVDKPSDISIGSGVMTTSTTSQDVKEIQGRQSAGRGAVIDAANKMRYSINNGHGLDDGPEIAAIIEAAMMALVEHWRAEADIWEAGKKRGSVGTAKEIRAAASRLAGFAVGLTTRPITNAERIGAMAQTWDDALSATCAHPAEILSTRKDGSTFCAQCQTVVTLAETFTATDVANIAVLRDDAGDDELPGMWSEADLIGGLTDALPADDPVRAAFATYLTGDEPVGTQVTVGGIEFTKIGTNPFGPDQTPEQNLRDIIGPLGASSVAATIDHPFTSPSVPWLNRRPVATLAYPQLAEIATATAGARDHVSHSYVESYENCSLSALLRDASRAGHLGAQRSGWSQIGGSAFHSAVEAVERAYLAGVVMTEAEAIWNASFDAAVKTRLDELVGTPYADSGTWYVSNRGKEGFDWWRVEGARMLKMYLDKHTPAWREANQVFRVADTTPVIEYPYEMTLRSLDGERGLTAQGFIDMARLNMTTYSLTVIDYKTGARDPESTFQLGEYGHALLMAMGIPAEPQDRPILGQYWLARKGIYTDAVPVLQRHPLDELQYRYDAAMRGTQAKIFSPHTSNLCKSCSSVDYCPTQGARS